VKLILFVLMSPLLIACGSSSDDSSISTSSDDSVNNAHIDITDAIFTRTSGNCADYAESYYADVQDTQTSEYFTGDLVVSVSDENCVFASNAIPNHDFNEGGNFATDIAEQNDSYHIPTDPTLASASSDLELGESAVFLNGVKLDLLAAACYGVGDEDLGKERIGCGQEEIDNPWRYDPMSSLNGFGTDSHNAHTQPDGTYHYHGSPEAMFEDDCSTVSAVIGFAFDGFPIMGSCITDDDGSIRSVVSSYELIDDGGERVAVSGYETPVAGTGVVASSNYDGQFIGDWEYVSGSGDLDECNGMTVDGQYAYYVSDSYPWVMGCYSGTPD